MVFSLTFLYFFHCDASSKPLALYTCRSKYRSLIFHDSFIIFETKTFFAHSSKKYRFTSPNRIGYFITHTLQSQHSDLSTLLTVQLQRLVLLFEHYCSKRLRPLLKFKHQTETISRYSFLNQKYFFMNPLRFNFLL